ncbi:MAG: hypothetical protein JWO31_2749 [Phycisphaerales bacterium]|nr:hypothetical protein [Phycisphaerales bacterium]
MGGGNTGTGTNPTGTLAASVAATVPTAVVAGQKVRTAAVEVSVTNPTAARIVGPVGLALFASTDAVLDAADPAVLTVTKKLAIGPGQTTIVSLKVRAVPAGAAAAGTYRIVGRVTAPDQSVTAAAAPTTFALAAPFVDLAGALTAAPAGILPAGRKASAVVRVENLGNVRAAGPVTLSFAASADQAASSDDAALVAKSVKLSLNPGKSRSVRVNFVPPASLPAGTYYLTVAIAASGQSADPDAANNLLVSAVPFTIG